MNESHPSTFWVILLKVSVVRDFSSYKTQPNVNERANFEGPSPHLVAQKEVLRIEFNPKLLD